MENLQEGGGGDQHPESTCSSVNSDLREWFLSRSAQAGIKHADGYGRSQFTFRSHQLTSDLKRCLLFLKCMQMVEATTQRDHWLVWKQSQYHPEVRRASAFAIWQACGASCTLRAYCFWQRAFDPGPLTFGLLEDNGCCAWTLCCHLNSSQPPLIAVEILPNIIRCQIISQSRQKYTWLLRLFRTSWCIPSWYPSFSGDFLSS